MVEARWRGGSARWRRGEARLTCVTRPTGPWARRLPRRMLFVTVCDVQTMLDCSRLAASEFAALARQLRVFEDCRAIDPGRAG